MQPSLSVRLSVRLGLLSLAAMAGLSACATHGDAVSKVKIQHLKPELRPQSGDPAIEFEYKRLLHGALTADEVKNRAGNYYSVYWQVADRSQPVTVRLEYRQTATGPKILSIEVPVDKIGRSNTTEFQITGEAFKVGGSVVSWRASVVRGKDIIASRKSAMWD